MSEPTPRQVLYALVAGGFLVVVAILIVGAAAAGLTPLWWSAVMGTMLLVVFLWSVGNWRKTAPVLLTAVGLLIVWVVGTLIVTA